MAKDPIQMIFISLVLLIGSFSFETYAVSVWEDTALTAKEKSALDKFKVLMNNVVPHDWMKTDIYLIKWLRARELNIPEAETMLRRHLKWRQEFEIDTIIDQDFGELPFEYPYTTNGIDYEGRPVLALSVADWDIRRAIVSGKKDELTRWMYRGYELGSRNVRKLQAEGQNVTQFIMVCNFDGFNLVQHVCVQCVTFLVDFLTSYESNFPGMADAIIAIKTPSTFEILLQALRRVMSKETQDAIRIYGTNKNEWQTYLLSKIPADQLDEDFGGTRFPEF